MYLSKVNSKNKLGNYVQRFISILRNILNGQIYFLDTFETWFLHTYLGLPRWIFWDSINKGWLKMNNDDPIPF